MDWFEDKLFDGIHSNGLFEKAGRILLAVSGGADSAAMAYALYRLRGEGRLECDFVIGHVNHGLRGAESDADEAFVRDLGKSLGMAVAAANEDVRRHAESHKLSIETSGRILRLKALAAMASEYGCNAIATAHHKNDLAETIIHRLMRGTGFRGLCGIWPVSEVYGARFIRPMLNLRRSEIIRYCSENHLSWREDASNRAVDFTRNRIRHRLLPVLENGSGTIVAQLSALSLKSRLFLNRVEKQARLIFEKGRLDKIKGQFIIEQDLVRDCPPWVFYEVIRYMLLNVGVGMRDYKQEHFNSVRQLCERKKAKADFPGGVKMAVEKSILTVSRRVGHLTHRRGSADDSMGGNHPPCVLEIGQTVQFGTWKISSRLLNRSEVDVAQFLQTKDSFVEWFDADKITAPVEIRLRQEGDRFWPIGAKSEKKIARFLLDAGLNGTQASCLRRFRRPGAPGEARIPFLRQDTFIITDSEKILWLAPIRISDPAKVTKNTRQILQLSVILI